MASSTCSACIWPLRRVSLRLVEARRIPISICPQLRLGARAVHSKLHGKTTPAPSSTEPSKPNRSAGGGLWEPIREPIREHLQNSDGTGLSGSVVLFGSAMSLIKSLIAGAAYVIPQETRKIGNVQKLEDGEEVGESRGPWHEFVDLPPTFSTWSQVTMLQLYVVIARARTLKPEAYDPFYKQMLDHFFQECETIMQVNHDMASAAARSSYLKDLFLQWRGVMAAYDEGVVRGDAVLASAVWRNLYKAREDVDVTKLGRVVAWMRQALCRLDKMPDNVFLTGGNLFPVLPGQAQEKSADQDAAAPDSLRYGEGTDPRG